MPEITVDTGPQLTLPMEPPCEAAPVVKDWRQEVPTVSQLTRRIRGHIEGTFFDLWVKGEVSNFRKPISGHAYFVVKDATCQMRAVMFRGQLSKVKFALQDGMECLFHGTISVYEAKGEYQLICDAVEPVGAGALQMAFEQLKQKLFKEGLFEAKHKKPLPALPKRIGIVTSATGAAVKDILKVLVRRFPNREILILPASVQGEKAAGEICQALELAERWNLEQPNRRIDVLIVGRGGGSLEDLWCFNEEVVARAIFKCTIPIISAVGHEIDTTIADFVADLRAPTPSAAAELVIPRLQDLAERVDFHTNRMRIANRRRFEQYRLHLAHLTQRLIDPRRQIRQTKLNFTNTQQRLKVAMANRLLNVRRRLESRMQLLDSLSPLNVIGRGYSLTQSESGKIIRQVSDAPAGALICTRVSDGVIRSRVE